MVAIMTFLLIVPFYFMMASLNIRMLLIELNYKVLYLEK